MTALAFLLTLFFCNSAFSTTLDEKITTVENYTSQLQDLQLNFVQKTFVKVLAKNIEKPGVLSLKKGGKFRIEYANKAEKTFVCNGEILWMLDPAVAEPQSFNARAGQVPEEVFTLLSEGKNLRKNFQISALENSSNKIALKLKPKKKSTYLSLEGIFSNTGAPETLRILNQSGNMTEYQFSQLKKNQALPEKLFDLSSGKATPDTLPE